MLLITTDGRKTGLDQRLIYPSYPDEPGTKVNECMENVYRIWDDTKDKRLTQLMFCDFSTPGKDKFNVYDDIRDKLIKKGIPMREIAYIHDADTEVKKKELFAKVRNGSVRVLMGSTQKMGSGTNVQDKLFALHDLDCPWRPSDLEQRAGRIIRQGNTNPQVHVYRYSTVGTFDSYLYQTLENKQKFISQVMTSKSPARSCEDVDESVLSYAEIKALCAGNPLIREKMDLDVQVSKLKMAKSSHQSSIYMLQDKLRKSYPAYIQNTTKYIESLNRDEELSARTRENKENRESEIPPAATGVPEAFSSPETTETLTTQGEAESRKLQKFPGMTIMEKTYTDREEAGKALLEQSAAVTQFAPVHLGSYRGFDMTVKYNEARKAPELTLKGEMSHAVFLGDSPSGNITRLNNALDGIGKRIAEQNERLENLHKQVQAAQEEIQRPFPFEAELEEKNRRLNELNIALNLDGGVQPDIADIVKSPGEEAAKGTSESGDGINERDCLIGHAKLRLGANAIITDAQRCKTYSGDVLEVGEEFVVQKISRDQGVVHSLQKAPGLSDLIEANGKGNLRVSYDRDGKCCVSQRGNAQDRDAAGVSY
jgi:hypothetical protein